MGSFWEQFVLSTVLGILSGLKRNPVNVPLFRTVLQHIVLDACEILGATPPTFTS